MGGGDATGVDQRKMYRQKQKDDESTDVPTTCWTSNSAWQHLMSVLLSGVSELELLLGQQVPIRSRESAVFLGGSRNETHVDHKETEIEPDDSEDSLMKLKKKKRNRNAC